MFAGFSDFADRSVFIGRVDCNRLWGRQRNRRESPSRPALYRRLFNADVAPQDPALDPAQGVP